MNGDYKAVCPYYLYEKGSNVMSCELCKFRFPDDEAKAQVKEYCCDMRKYKECQLYKVMNSYYERKYEEVKNEQRKAD